MQEIDQTCPGHVWLLYRVLADIASLIFFLAKKGLVMFVVHPILTMSDPWPREFMASLRGKIMDICGIT